MLELDMSEVRPELGARGDLKGPNTNFFLVFKSSLAGEKGERLKLNEVALREHVAQKC